jgi:hypothetical protein
VSDASELIVESRTQRPLAFDLSLGFAAGLVLTLLTTVFDMMLRRWNLNEIPLGGYLVIWPTVGILVGYVRRRRAAAPMHDSPSEEEQEQRQRRRGRFVTTGFAIGLVLGFVSTMLDLAWRGWFILPFQLILNLLIFPYFGVLLGFNLNRVPGEPKWSWRFLRFNMRTMMLVVAYVALLFGLGVVTGRIGESARRYHQQYMNAKQMADVFGGILRKEQAQAPLRLRNAEVLRDEMIPADLMQGQKDFLKSLDLDKKVKPDHRKLRYDLIADGEEIVGRMAEKNVQTYTTLVDYYAKLAVKYKKAQHEPWLPVEPDPPKP